MFIWGLNSPTDYVTVKSRIFFFFLLPASASLKSVAEFTRGMQQGTQTPQKAFNTPATLATFSGPFLYPVLRFGEGPPDNQYQVLKRGTLYLN